MRAFIGLPLPDDVVTAFEAVQAELDVGRAVPGENLHLTLAFLDDQPEHALMALHDVLCNVSGAVPTLHITGLGVLGEGKPKLLFAEVANDPPLTALRKKIHSAVREADIDLPRTRFRPHVTLARFGQLNPGEMEKLQRYFMREGAFTLPPFGVDHFALYQSTLNPGGAVYDVLAEYPLG